MNGDATLVRIQIRQGFMIVRAMTTLQYLPFRTASKPKLRSAETLETKMRSIIDPKKEKNCEVIPAELNPRFIEECDISLLKNEVLDVIDIIQATRQEYADSTGELHTVTGFSDEEYRQLETKLKNLVGE